MWNVLRMTLLLVLCLAFGALVGVALVAPRFGVRSNYLAALSHVLTVAGGAVGFFGALLAPRLWWAWRSWFAVVGGAASGALAYLVARIIFQGGQPLMIGIAVPVWGMLLGIWVGSLHSNVLHGPAGGLLIFAVVTGLGLYFGHPDPAGFVGAAAGFLIWTLLCRSQQRPRLVRRTRAVAAGLVVLVATVFLLIGQHEWPAMQRFELTSDRIGTGGARSSLFLTER